MNDGRSYDISCAMDLRNRMKCMLFLFDIGEKKPLHENKNSCMAFEDMEYSAQVYEQFLRCFPFTVLKNNTLKTFPFIVRRLSKVWGQEEFYFERN